MHYSLVLAFVPLVSAYHNRFNDNTSKTLETFFNKADPSTVCGLLKHKFSNLTFVPADYEYQKENEGISIYQSFFLSFIISLTFLQSPGHHQHG
jgi:hypothetical protein